MKDPENYDDIILPEGFVNPLSELLEQSKGGTILLVEEELIDPADIKPEEVH